LSIKEYATLRYADIPHHVQHTTKLAWFSHFM